MQLNTQTDNKPKASIKTFLTKAIDWRFVLLGIFIISASHTVMFDSIAPFGLSMLAACKKKDRWNTYALIMHLIGCILISSIGFNATPYITGGIIIMLLMQLYRDMSPLLAVGLTLTAVRLPLIIIDGLNFYDITMLGIEIVLGIVFVPVLSRFIVLLMSRSPKRRTDSDDIFAVFSAMCIVVMSTAEVMLPFNINLSSVLCAYLIMLMSMTGGFAFGGGAGVILGIVSRLYLIPDPAVIGIYAVCGFLCAAVRRLGRWGIITGFILASSSFIIFTPLQIPVAFTITEQIAGAVLLLLTSSKTVAFLENTVIACFPEPAYATRLKSTVSNRLVQASVALDKLSGYIKKISSEKDDYPSNDIFTVFDRTANKICKSCLASVQCWQREYDVTAAALMDTSVRLEEDGFLEKNAFPSHFRNKCKKIEQFTEEVNRQYDNYKIQQVLHRKSSVGEDMAAQQIKDFSKIIDGINSRLTREITFDTDLEQQLTEALSSLPFALHTINAVIDHKGRYDISITVSTRHLVKTEELTDIVSQVTGKNMEISEITEAHNRETVHFTEAAPYTVKWGQASAPKTGQEVCGDSKAVYTLNDGRVLLALSDGMGSGESAAKQSDATIELLGKFLEAGFDTQSTLRMINSILLLRTNAEAFATVDIAMIDKYSGSCEFIKIGANSTYILNNHKVRQISSASLPAGILTEIDAEKTTARLKDGSCVILLSDGIEAANDPWVAGYIATLPPCEPQALADSILKAATEHFGGRDDDMTVITARISKGELKNAG